VVLPGMGVTRTAGRCDVPAYGGRRRKLSRHQDTCSRAPAHARPRRRGACV